MKVVHLPTGDLTRTITHEPDETWPTMIEVVAYWGDGRTKRRSIEIPADEFFGRGVHGAPMPGERLIAMVEQLRRQGPLKPKK